MVVWVVVYCMVVVIDWVEMCVVVLCFVEVQLVDVCVEQFFDVCYVVVEVVVC